MVLLFICNENKIVYFFQFYVWLDDFWYNCNPITRWHKENGWGWRGSFVLRFPKFFMIKFTYLFKCFFSSSYCKEWTEINDWCNFLHFFLWFWLEITGLDKLGRFTKVLSFMKRHKANSCHNKQLFFFSSNSTPMVCLFNLS